MMTLTANSNWNFKILNFFKYLLQNSKFYWKILNRYEVFVILGVGSAMWVFIICRFVKIVVGFQLVFALYLETSLSSREFELHFPRFWNMSTQCSASNRKWYFSEFSVLHKISWQAFPLTRCIYIYCNPKGKWTSLFSEILEPVRIS